MKETVGPGECDHRHCNENGASFRLTNAEVGQMRRMYADGVSLHRIAVDFRVDRHYARMIVNRRARKCDP